MKQEFSIFERFSFNWKCPVHKDQNQHAALDPTFLASPCNSRKTRGTRKGRGHLHFYFCSPTHLLFISSSSTLTLTKRALDPRHGRRQCVSVFFFFFFLGHWELPCAPRPTASHDVPPRSAWTACRALISAHVSSPLECAGFLTPKEEQLKSAGSLLLDSYPKNARFGTAMLSYCQNGTQFPCRVRRLHQRLALACPSIFPRAGDSSAASSAGLPGCL